MARMQCPRCEVIVKLDDQVVAIHDVVRCANCQGLIPVKQCTLPEQTSQPRRPGKRRKTLQRKNNTSKIMLLVSLLVAAVLIVVSLTLILKPKQPPEMLANATQPVAAINDRSMPAPSFPPSEPSKAEARKEAPKLTYTQLLRREESLLNEMVTLLDGIQTLEQAKAGVAKMKQIRTNLNETRDQLEEAARTVSKEEWAENLPHFANKAQREQQHDQRYFAARERLMANPEFAPYVEQYTENSIGVNRFDLQRGSGKKEPPEK